MHFQGVDTILMGEMNASMLPTFSSGSTMFPFVLEAVTDTNARCTSQT